MTDTPSLVGYGGADDTLMHVDNPAGIYMDSGVIRSHAPWGQGFDLPDFENPLQFCPLNPESIKANSNFSPKDFKSLSLQDSKAFPGQDPEKPDDIYYFYRAIAVVARPPCLFTKTMRLFMQCLYGARTKKGLKKNLTIVVEGQDDNKVLLGSLKLGNFELSPDVILHIDQQQFRYFLIRLGSNSAQIVEIVFDAQGKKLLNQLRKGANYSKIDKGKVEGFLFSCAKETKNLQEISGQFDISPYGAPLLHWWHGNNDGSRACMTPVIVTEYYIESCIAELTISKISQPNPQTEGEWTDTWSFSLNVSQQSRCNPRTGVDNIFVNNQTVSGGTFFYGPAATASMYCWYRDSNETPYPINYFASGNLYEVDDTGWSPAPRNDPFDEAGLYCGMVNASREQEYRYNFQRFGFGDSTIETGQKFKYSRNGVSAGAHSREIAVFTTGDDCTGEELDVDTIPFTTSHVGIEYFRQYTYTESRQYETLSGFCFMFIPSHDAEACYTGSRQITDKAAPDRFVSTSLSVYKVDHFHWDPSVDGGPNNHAGKGDFAGTTYVVSSAAPGIGDTTYIPGDAEYTDSRSASCVLNAGSRDVNTEGHNSLYIQPAYGGGSTGFQAYVQQSALTGRAVYGNGGSGNGLAGDALCDGSSMGYYDAFIGLV